jgi:hypothetical protein
MIKLTGTIISRICIVDVQVFIGSVTIEVNLWIWINKTPYQSEKSTNAAQDDDKYNAAQDDNLKKQNK